MLAISSAKWQYMYLCVKLWPPNIVIFVKCHADPRYFLGIPFALILVPQKSQKDIIDDLINRGLSMMQGSRFQQHTHKLCPNAGALR